MTTEPAQHPNLVGRVIGDYRIVSLVGRGGMGEVYRADHLRLGRAVALKRLPPEYAADADRRRRFEREARAVAALNHPNIVTIYSVEEAGGLTFLTMELVEGQQLAKLIPNDGMDPETLLETALQLADALHAAHSKGVIHRDLKPQNIMVSDEGRVKILDFGLARLTAKGDDTETTLETLTVSQTRNGRLIGTLPYMAPEQVRGEESDTRSDIFSLGGILYEMATGSRPFPSESVADLISEILVFQPTPVDGTNPRMPQGLASIIDRCLRKDPDDRFQSAGELRDRLRAHKTDIQLSSATAALEPPRPRQLKRLAWTGAALLLALLVFFFTRRWERQASVGELSPASRQVSEAAQAPRKKIVVLPFQNLGPPEEEYFASGVADEIATRLGKVPTLGVISRVSSLQYADGAKSLQQIGAELAVDYVLEGTVRWDSGSDGSRRVRVLPKLNRVADNIQIWSEPYERVLEDIFAVQSDIAEEVLNQLELTIEAGRMGAATPPTTELEAYQAYLRGLDLSHSLSYDVPALRRASEMFARATEIDPEFAVAFARLSRVHSYLYFNYSMPGDLSSALRSLDRALEIDPELPEVLVARGFFRYYALQDYPEALAELRRAADALPNNFEVLQGIGWVLRRMGRFEEAVRRLEEAFELDPRVGHSALVIAETYRAMRDFEAEARYLDRAIRLAPDHAFYWSDRAYNEFSRTGSTAAAHQLLSGAPVRPDDPELAETDILLALYDGDWQGVVDRFSRLDPESIEPNTYSRLSWRAALAMERLGRKSEGRELLEQELSRLDERMQESAGDGFLHALRGITLSRLGRAEEALSEAERTLSLRGDEYSGPFLEEEVAVIQTFAGKRQEAIARIARLLRTDYYKAITRTRIRIDPVWDSLRSEPGFSSLLN